VNTSVKIIDFGTAKELEPTEKVRNLNVDLKLSANVAYFWL
jgi:hypothetical protein